MDAIPPNAHLYLPVLVAEYKKVWPIFTWPEFLAAQIEQETCISAKSKRCWNPKTENINPKNNNEYGFGLGQLTKTNKFNAFEEVVAASPDLKSWKWENRFDAGYQIKALVYMDKKATKSLVDTSEYNKAAFAFSAYNGGLGGVLNDRKYCKQFTDCDYTKWFGHVETHSHKSKTKLSGYRISAYEINRDYVRNIMLVRSEKYKVAIKKLIDK